MPKITTEAWTLIDKKSTTGNSFPIENSDFFITGISIVVAYLIIFTLNLEWKPMGRFNLMYVMPILVGISIFIWIVIVKIGKPHHYLIDLFEYKLMHKIHFKKYED